MERDINKIHGKSVKENLRISLFFSIYMYELDLILAVNLVAKLASNMENKMLKSQTNFRIKSLNFESW